MTVYADNFNEAIIHLLNNGGIGVIRTDTIYGIVTRADNEASVERLYELKNRTPSKSPIVLISSVSQLFDYCDQEVIDRLYKLWPGKVSIILPSTDAPYWIRRENNSVAYRLPGDEKLRALLEKTGPLVAPSANPEGLPTAVNIEEAAAYFEDRVDFYVNGGTVTDDTPSQLYRLHADSLERLR